MTHNPALENMQISPIREIDPVRPSDGYYWLGFWLSYSNHVVDILSGHLNKMTFKITKFYNWLDMKEAKSLV